MLNKHQNAHAMHALFNFTSSIPETSVADPDPGLGAY
jgi:hypothetical protein